MQIILFGGAFNPPHLGHLIVIQQAFELITNLDQLWLLPAYKHTFQKRLNSPTHRINMLKLLHNQLPQDIKSKVKICHIEIDFKMSGETYETLQKLKSEITYLKQSNLLPPPSSLLPNFSFLMGSDNLNSFKKWGNWQKLLESMPFYIYPRSGYGGKPKFDHMTLLESPTQTITNLSSTLIRNRIKKGQSINNLLPQPLIAYIRKHQLYR